MGFLIMGVIGYVVKLSESCPFHFFPESDQSTIADNHFLLCSPHPREQHPRRRCLSVQVSWCSDRSEVQGRKTAEGGASSTCAAMASREKWRRNASGNTLARNKGDRSQRRSFAWTGAAVGCVTLERCSRHVNAKSTLQTDEREVCLSERFFACVPVFLLYVFIYNFSFSFDLVTIPVVPHHFLVILAIINMIHRL